MTGLLMLASLLVLPDQPRSMPLVGDDLTLNDTALAQAIDRGVVDLGPGTYRLAAQTLITHGVTIRGAGPGRTILKYVGPGGLQIQIANSWQDRVLLADLTVTSTIVNACGICITDTGSWQATIERAAIVRDVEIRPETFLDGGYFVTGLKFDSVWNATVERVTVHGPTVGLPVPGTRGVVFDGWSAGPFLSQGLFAHLDVAVEMKGNSEGIELSNSQAALVNIGFLQSSVRTVPAPVGFISNFHAAALARGIYITNGVDAVVSNPIIYRHPFDVDEFVAIQFTGSGWRNKVIGGNVVKTGSGGPTYGLVSDRPGTQWVGTYAEGFDVPRLLQTGAAVSQDAGNLP